MKSAENPYLPLAAPWIAGLTPYAPGKPISELERELGVRDPVKLASNENPLGPGPAARAALVSGLGELGRYPDGGAYALRQRLADYHIMPSSSIVLGNGSNDVLDLVARTFLQPGTEAVFSEHAFAVYAIATQSVGATARIAPAREFGHDLAALAERVNARTRVVWIANPNNPTGTWLTAEPLRAFIAGLPERCIVVVDEAYFEYVEAPDYPNTACWTTEFPNLIVARTFSKAHGLAALRVGYGICNPQIGELLNRMRQPFNVNMLGQLAAGAAISDREHVARSVELNRTGLAQLGEAFDQLGLDYLPSVGNFIAVDLGRPVGPINDLLLRKGVIVRPIGNYGMPNHLRVSVGLAEENARFIAALEDVMADLSRT